MSGRLRTERPPLTLPCCRCLLLLSRELPGPPAVWGPGLPWPGQQTTHPELFLPPVWCPGRSPPVRGRARRLLPHGGREQPEQAGQGPAQVHRRGGLPGQSPRGGLHHGKTKVSPALCFSLNGLKWYLPLWAPVLFNCPRALTNPVRDGLSVFSLEKDFRPFLQGLLRYKKKPKLFKNYQTVSKKDRGEFHTTDK